MDHLGEIFTFALGVFGSYLGLHWKVRKDLESEYDKTLRDARLRVYQTLWQSLEPMAKYAREERVTFQTLRDLSGELRSWYFGEGGLYLSESTRDAYFALQDALDPYVTRENQSGSLDDVAFERLRKLGSQVRTAMAADVGTRNEPLLKTDN